MIAEKSGVQKILIDEDFIKDPIYQSIRMHPGITSLITERDKAVYRQKRRLISPGFSISYLNGLEPLMKDCLGVFERCLNAEVEKGGGYAVIDMNQMIGNLTSVYLFPSLSIPSLTYSGCHECNIIRWLLRLGRIK